MAHPRSNYEKHPELFKKYKIIKGKTIDLVKNSKLVLMHCSTSVNYAVIYKKPIIILDSIVWSSVDWIVNQIYSLTTTLG